MTDLAKSSWEGSQGDQEYKGIGLILLEKDAPALAALWARASDR